ncbi:MAG: ribosome assembly cofactor RimP [Bacteroidales bacterium]
MISKQKIADLIEEHLTGSDKFLVEFSVSPFNKIIVFIDGDNGVTITDCIALSRKIESNLDRETEDFELDVSSAGLDLGLRVNRQYIKNIGRTVDVKLNDNTKLCGILKVVDDKNITLELLPSKKKKKTDEIIDLNKIIDFKDIKETKVVITFK